MAYTKEELLAALANKRAGADASGGPTATTQTPAGPSAAAMQEQAPTGEMTGMEMLAEGGRGALGDYADKARAGLSSAMAMFSGDDEGLSSGDLYDSYKQGADIEEEQVAYDAPATSNLARGVGTVASLAIPGGAIKALPAARGLTKATAKALEKGASKVAPKAYKAAKAYRRPLKPMQRNAKGHFMPRPPKKSLGEKALGLGKGLGQKIKGFGTKAATGAAAGEVLADDPLAGATIALGGGGLAAKGLSKAMAAISKAKLGKKAEAAAIRKVLKKAGL